MVMMGSMLRGQKNQINNPHQPIPHHGDFLFIRTSAGAVVTYAFARYGDTVNFQAPEVPLV
jgi:hypothetical protein